LKKIIETAQAEKPKEEGFDQQKFPEAKVQDLGVLKGKKRAQDEQKKNENGIKIAKLENGTSVQNKPQ